MIYLASDHGGYELKEFLKSELEKLGEDFEDLGCHSSDSVDYPDLAHDLAEQILANPDSKGIAVCGTGIGISIALNRHAGIRAALCQTAEYAELARQHNNANILALGGRFVAKENAQKILKTFLETKFEGGRHERRVCKIEI